MMKINNKEINVDEITSYLNYDITHKSYNGLYLNDNQINVLTKYGFDYTKYSSMNSLLFDIEEYLNEQVDCDDLELVSQEIAEFSYYHDTKK